MTADDGRFGANILNWYPFSGNEKVLAVGECKAELLGLLNQKCLSASVIPNDSELLCFETEDRFDCILFVSLPCNCPLSELIGHFERFLTVGGRFFLCVDNKFGIRQFAGSIENAVGKRFQSLIGYSDEPKKIYSYCREDIVRILEDMGLNYRFYYPLPDCKMPNVIFTDDSIPEFNNVGKYCSYNGDDPNVVFGEIDVFREILKSDKKQFLFFANSFFIEVSRSEVNKRYRYISFNDMRKEKYRLITKIGEKSVEKQPVSIVAEGHYNAVKENTEYIAENGFGTVDTVENGVLKSKYTDESLLLSAVLTRFLENGQTDEFLNTVDTYVGTVGRDMYRESNAENTVFSKYGIKVDEKTVSKLHFLKKGFWDMTFKNCFYKDGELLFFDQEWCEEGVPVEFILYRSFLYTISLRRYINIEELLARYNISEFSDIFAELDEKLQESIRSDEIWQFFSRERRLDIDATLTELKNLQIRSEAQIGAIENLNKDIECYKERQSHFDDDIRQIKEEYDALVARNNKRFTVRLKRLIKKCLKKLLRR